MSDIQTTHLDTQLPIRFLLEKNGGTSKNLLLFLHGYTDSASSFLRRALGGEKLPFDYLAPNAPFPVPVRTEDGFKEAYSWYFEDHSIGRVIIPKDVPIGLLKKLLSQLGLEQHRKTIIGFSQGGFMAPKLSEQLSQVEKIIGIGCLYRAEGYENLNKNIRVYGIHGTEDGIVSCADAVKGHKDLMAKGFQGEFAEFANLSHTINADARATLKRFILA